MIDYIYSFIKTTETRSTFPLLECSNELLSKIFYDVIVQQNRPVDLFDAITTLKLVCKRFAKIVRANEKKYLAHYINQHRVATYKLGFSPQYLTNFLQDLGRRICYVDLTYCDFTDLQRINILFYCRNIEELRLGGNTYSFGTYSGPLASTVLGLGVLKELRVLSLIKSDDIGPKQIRQIAKKVPGLEWLNVKGCPRIGDEGFFYIGKMKNLVALNIKIQAVTFQRMEALSSLQHLEKLWMASNVIEERAITLLPSFSKLNFLSIECNLLGIDARNTAEVNDDALECISRCKELETLKLYCPPISDRGVTYLQRLENLTTLGLMADGITDQGLLTLIGCKKLTALYLTRNEHISTRAIRQLQVARPDITIDIKYNYLENGLWSMLIVNQVPVVTHIFDWVMGVGRE